MKNSIDKNIILFVLVFIIFNGCNGEAKKTKNSIDRTTKKEQIFQTKISREARNTIDSLREVHGFAKAIALAKSNDNFFKTSDTLEVSIFETKEKYVFIRFQSSFQRTKIGLYQLADNSIDTIFEKRYEAGYSLDTIQDINGDQYLDVLTTFYSPSGCCLRDLVTVRLYNPMLHKFEEGIEFMNPTFLPNQQLIVGVQYGHSGQVPLYKYKYKWDGSKVKTIEYIFPLEGSKEDYLLVNETSDFSKEAALQNDINIIQELPEEYEASDALEWFLYYQEEERESDQ